jgi:hypothetical protein
MSFIEDVKNFTSVAKQGFSEEKDPVDRMLNWAGLFVAAALAGVLLFLAVAIFISLLKFIIPGLIVAGLAYWFFVVRGKGKINLKK